MAHASDWSTPPDSRSRGFATTRWSLVRASGGEDSGAHEALQVLCRTYWYPLYAYVRRRGFQPAAAQDHTQAFFTHLLEGERIQSADPDRGRFRSFLLKSLQNFLSSERRRERAEKRGGGRPLLPLDFEQGEERYLKEPADTDTPERLFERRWALTLLETTLARLHDEYGESGKGALFAALQPHLHGDSDRMPLAELAVSLGTSPEAIKVAAHRLRRRYRDLLRQEISETVDSPEEVDDELRRLMNALS
jgi:RNA polymerase sigma-70 factor (ECF subfamily)